MRIEDFFVFCVVVFNTFLGFLVITRNSSRRNLFFFLLIIFLNLYFLTNTFIDYDITREFSLLLARLVFFFPAFLPILLTLFVSSFLQRGRLSISHKRLNVVLLMISFVLGFLALFTKTITFDIDNSIMPVEIVRGDLYLLYIGGMLINVIYFLWMVFHVKPKLSGLERLQFNYFVTGAVSTMILMLISNLVLPAIGVNNFVRLPGIFSVIFTGSTTYAIVRHKLFSIKTITIIIVKYLFLTLLFMTAVFGVRLVKDYVIGVSYYSYQSVLIDTIIAFIIAISTEPFLAYINRSLSLIIKPEVYQLEGIVEEINHELKGDTEFEVFLEKVLDVLKNHFYNSQVFLVIKKVDDLTTDGTYEYRVLPEKEDIYSIKDMAKLISTVDDTVVVQKDLRELSELERKFHDNGVLIVSKITDSIRIVFTEKETRQAYTHAEIDTIGEIIEELKQIFTILEINEQIKNFNQTLQAKINKATSELQVKNKQLEDTLRKERDMMDILGHELRTPLTIGKNAMRMLKQTYEEQGKIDKETMEKYLEMADENLSREAKLLETLLSTTKIDNKAVSLHFEKVDLIDAVNDSLDALKEKADLKNLKVVFEPPKEAFVYADRNRTQEVVDNLVDNAIKYTQQGSVTIEIIPGHVQTSLKITDTGVGMSKTDIAKLGQKFYRINTYLDSSKESDYKVVRPGGTGLGLYVTFNLVELMNGTINVDSEVGKGSVFAVNLPTYKGQKETDNGASDKKTVYERFEEKKKQNDTKS